MNSSLKFGLFGGLLLTSTLLIYSIDVNNSYIYSIWTLVQLAIIVFSIYFGVKEERKVKHNGSIAYRDAIFTALKINFIIAVIHSVSIFFYYSNNPEAIIKLKKQHIEQAIEDHQKLKSDESVVKNHIAFINKDITPFNQAKTNFMIILVIGLVISMIVTAILRKKDEEPIAQK